MNKKNQYPKYFQYLVILSYALIVDSLLSAIFFVMLLFQEIQISPSADIFVLRLLFSMTFGGIVGIVLARKALKEERLITQEKAQIYGT